MPELKPVETGPLPPQTTRVASLVEEAGTVCDGDRATRQEARRWKPTRSLVGGWHITGGGDRVEQFRENARTMKEKTERLSDATKAEGCRRKVERHGSKAVEHRVNGLAGSAPPRLVHGTSAQNGAKRRPSQEPAWGTARSRPLHNASAFHNKPLIS